MKKGAPTGGLSSGVSPQCTQRHPTRPLREPEDYAGSARSASLLHHGSESGSEHDPGSSTLGQCRGGVGGPQPEPEEDRELGLVSPTAGGAMDTDDGHGDGQGTHDGPLEEVDLEAP